MLTTDLIEDLIQKCEMDGATKTELRAARYLRELAPPPGGSMRMQRRLYDGTILHVAIVGIRRISIYQRKQGEHGHTEALALHEFTPGAAPFKVVIEADEWRTNVKQDED